MVRMRAIENHRWVLRATNTGITASIDPYGRVVASLPRRIRASVNVPYGYEQATTFYTRHGDWFAYLCAVVTLAMLGMRFRVNWSHAGRSGIPLLPGARQDTRTAGVSLTQRD
jgi:apolipoprotein N-acyltransferase